MVMVGSGGLKKALLYGKWWNVGAKGFKSVWPNLWQAQTAISDQCTQLKESVDKL